MNSYGHLDMLAMAIKEHGSYLPVPSISAVRSSFETCSFGVDSSHTVCQIPLHGVYQIMPSRFNVCFPIGIWTISTSVGSKVYTSL